MSMSRAVEDRARANNGIRERYFIFVSGVSSGGCGESQEQVKIHCGEVMILYLLDGVANSGAPSSISRSAFGGGLISTKYRQWKAGASGA